jgi:hypothetical protein
MRLHLRAILQSARILSRSCERTKSPEFYWHAAKMKGNHTPKQGEHLRAMPQMQVKSM